MKWKGCLSSFFKPGGQAGRARPLCALVVFFVMAVSVGPAAVKVPQWLLDEVTRPLPSFSPETEAVVLLDEQSTAVNPKGALFTTCRRAIRVLRPGGAETARRLVRASTYDTKVRSMTGWVIKPTGETRRATMKEAITSSLAPDTLYMDAKLIMLILPEVEAGSMVGLEWEEERTPPSLEDIFEFQGPFPALRARYSLSLPALWTAEFRPVNWSPLEPRQYPSNPHITILEIQDIPAIVEEPFMPNERALAGRVIVRIGPPDPDSRSFADWAGMGAWYEKLSSERCLPDEVISMKTAALTAEVPDTFGKLCVLADFVQKEIRYVSIQIGIGGFQPHAAPSILVNRYGDCKDKATLLSAMLQAIGIESCPNFVHTERDFVTMESPVSLYSFNHAILAIRLPDDVPDEAFDSLVRHPGLGRLLIFDPTMPTTPLGRLPYYLQDNTALLVGGGRGELIRLPPPGPERNLLERSGRLVLMENGALSGEIQEIRRGSMADSLRYEIQTAPEADRRKYLETFLSRFFAHFTLEKYEFQNLDTPHEDLIVRYRINALSYAKRAGGFLILRPRVVGQRAVDLVSRKKENRRYPIDFETTSLARDEFIFELPEGFTPDGLPDAVHLDPGFAVYTSSIESGGRELRYRREYRLIEPRLPASRFDEALDFFIAVAAEERQSVLLKNSDSRRP